MSQQPEIIKLQRPAGDTTLYRRHAHHLRQHKGIPQSECPICQMFTRLINDSLPPESITPRSKTP